jgi:phosphoribulokinase
VRRSSKIYSKMQQILLALAFGYAYALAPTRTALRSPRTTVRSSQQGQMSMSDGVVLIGVAADSGCGKSTFMRRLTGIFGGTNVGPLGGGFDAGSWETNTLVSDTTTVICLDDYHLNDREGRKVSKRTALDLAENNFDLMFEQLKELKAGKTISKPIYNHVNGTLDTPEKITPTPIVIVEGLHPMADERVRELLDFSLYLDITDDVKFAWKIQRDMVERGHSLESIQQSIEARKPDFDAFVAPQREFADVVLQVLPTDLIPDEKEGKVLKVKMIQKEGKADFDPCYLFDEGSTIEWTPCGKKLTCSYPGIKFAYGPDTFLGNDVTVVEMDGKFDNLQELIYVESHLSNTATKFYGELTQQMIKMGDSPGSDNGTGFFQTLASLKLREFYEKKTGKVVEVEQPKVVA